MSFVVAAAGSGGLMFAIMLVLSSLMQEWDTVLSKGQPSTLVPLLREASGNLSTTEWYANVSSVADSALHHHLSTPYMRSLVRDPYFIAFWMMCAGTTTLIIYYLGAQYIHNEYYVKRRADAAEWKCQPTKFLSDELALEEKLTGCWNAFVSGSAGTGLFFLHQNYPIFKFYYDVDERGWLHYLAGCFLVYLWVDFYSYWMHRLLHHKAIYKYVHKWHHRYKCPTAFGAFAIHPIEYIGFQTAGIWCSAIFPVHVMSFLTVVMFVAYHNQIDHSGVYFEGELPWVPTTKFHDDHHQYFHLNFGVTLVLWDWLFGTLRQSDRVYGEEVFEGEQDVKKTQ
ncbi:6) desaturase) (Sterol-C5-desaturase) [Durusdinium trenchii]|uniref:6 desaturase (Sterol-C5-desaturase n=1 Tax=Durusdinium trenchii TaxID=1381693 RepID=A0ABP0IY49_9DINO